LFALTFGERYQALLYQIALITPGFLTGELLDVLVEARDSPDIFLLDVENQRT
jgi:hypothetical protein